MRIPKITWRSPIVINQLSGDVLAMILRLSKTHKTYDKRTPQDLPSVLTKDQIPVLAPTFAYIHFLIEKYCLKTREQMVAMLANSEVRSSEVTRWSNKNRNLVEDARKLLSKLIGKKGRSGFSCYG